MYNNFMFSQGFSKLFFQVCYVATMAKIWLRVSEDSWHFLESCYALVTSKNLVSKSGNFHVFLLWMWQTKRHLKEFCNSKKEENPVSKYDDFQVFLLRMWSTKKSSEKDFQDNKKKRKVLLRCEI
jgi:hypothetical protein